MHCKCPKSNDMHGFSNYIKSTRQILSNTNLKLLHIVMGNESCDLDSLVSSISFAYYLHVNNTLNVIPLLNIPRKEFPLRTEHQFVLNKVGISGNDLIFRDDVDLHKLHENINLKVSLVDHHILRSEDDFLINNISQIFDHRPIDPNFKLQSIATIEEVGSCSTLIAREIFSKNEELWCDHLASIIYDTIVFDTIHLDPQAGRVKELDKSIVEKLRIKFPFLSEPKPLFDKLWAAHNDTSGLTPYEILFKDLKVVDNIPVPGVSNLVKEFLKLANVTQHLNEFCKHHGSSLVVLVGLSANEGKVERDLAIFYKQYNLAKILLDKFKNAESFQWEEEQLQIPNLIYLKQGNVKLTRKHIIPLIKNVNK